MKSSVTFYSSNVDGFDLIVNLTNGFNTIINNISFPYTFDMLVHGTNTINGTYIFKKGRCEFIREIMLMNCDDDITIDINEVTTTTTTPSPTTTTTSISFEATTTTTTPAPTTTTTTPAPTTTTTTTEVTETTTLPTFNCDNNKLRVEIFNGMVGDDVDALVTYDGEDVDYISIDPTEYYEGDESYSVSFIVPNGYSNSGQTMECDGNGIGTLPTTTTTTTIKDPTFGGYEDGGDELDVEYTGRTYGTVGDPNSYYYSWKVTHSDSNDGYVFINGPGIDGGDGTIDDNMWRNGSDFTLSGGEGGIIRWTMSTQDIEELRDTYDMILHVRLHKSSNNEVIDAFTSQP